MPNSHPAFDEEVRSIIQARDDFHSYYDIGPGSGKFGKMVREIRGTDCKLGAVEIHEPYVMKYDLLGIYDAVAIEDACDMVNGPDPGVIADMIYIGDCIEHMPKSRGVDLLNYLVYRSKLVLLVFPTAYTQYAAGGVESESHKSVWGREDFRVFDHTYRQEGFMNFVGISGYVGRSTNPKHKL
jgi:hypothetical protein